ncbi:MAG TPA: SUMF1/EgtB/PvdO family nonheme iron enzyme, partial [Desulfurivibrionaceae bacterium]|nr:SUMF1/EgtB/PvdO family nonheme iron enzyme [Desulfurivibrionaceae bacterium]
TRWGRTSVDEPDYKYPYNPQDGRENLAGPDLRVLRGGSWYFILRLARCASRLRYFPVFFSNDIGFRVVVSLAGAGF